MTSAASCAKRLLSRFSVILASTPAIARNHLTRARTSSLKPCVVVPGSQFEVLPVHFILVRGRSLMVFHAANACSLFEVSMKPGSYGARVVTGALVVATDVVAEFADDESTGACPGPLSAIGDDESEPVMSPRPDVPAAMMSAIAKCFLRKENSESLIRK